MEASADAFLRSLEHCIAIAEHFEFPAEEFGVELFSRHEVLGCQFYVADFLSHSSCILPNIEFKSSHTRLRNTRFDVSTAQDPIKRSRKSCLKLRESTLLQIRIFFPGVLPSGFPSRLSAIVMPPVISPRVSTWTL